MRNTESQRAKAAYPPSSEGLTLQTKEERGADHGYIRRFISVLYVCCRSCWPVLYGLQGEKVAATIRSSDG